MSTQFDLTMKEKLGRIYVQKVIDTLLDSFWLEELLIYNFFEETTLRKFINIWSNGINFLLCLIFLMAPCDKILRCKLKTYIIIYYKRIKHVIWMTENLNTFFNYGTENDEIWRKWLTQVAVDCHNYGNVCGTTIRPVLSLPCNFWRLKQIHNEFPISFLFSTEANTKMFTSIIEVFEQYLNNDEYIYKHDPVFMLDEENFLLAYDQQYEQQEPIRGEDGTLWKYKHGTYRGWECVIDVKPDDMPQYINNSIQCEKKYHLSMITNEIELNKELQKIPVDIINVITKMCNYESNVVIIDDKNILKAGIFNENVCNDLIIIGIDTINVQNRNLVQLKKYVAKTVISKIICIMIK